MEKPVIDSLASWAGQVEASGLATRKFVSEAFRLLLVLLWPGRSRQNLRRWIGDKKSWKASVYAIVGLLMYVWANGLGDCWLIQVSGGQLAGAW